MKVLDPGVAVKTGFSQVVDTFAGLAISMPVGRGSVNRAEAIRLAFVELSSANVRRDVPPTDTVEGEKLLEKPVSVDEIVKFAETGPVTPLSDRKSPVVCV